MAEALVEGPIGAALITFITAQRTALGLGSAGVSARVEDAPHVRIVESGGGGDHDLVIFTQQITIETFGKTLTESAALMRATMAGMRSVQHTIQSGVVFYGLRTFGGGSNSEDPTTGRCRYTRTIAIDSRLQSIA